ncbi:hypothetical protein QO034_13260 [Sedimentitalea sp. JM2-8]|uniref:Uncharacterized protein n=1 Tax=Sedimentitalea xiamensis TaxID=3050037 RepID=A0ABT7FH25_9RHOB|nr:hypothetical protein [Sedimentitalea xiamensis]MDK3074084.1 hypothetical protein [Sedimentitalea xiamensis]
MPTYFDGFSAEPGAKRGPNAMKIVILIAFVIAAGWWLTSEPSDYERGMWCMDLGYCDND